MNRSIRRRLALTGILVVLFAVSSLLATGVTAQPTPWVASPAEVARKAPAPCPSPVPVAKLQPGMRGTGLTVSQGTTPETFSVKVLGVLADAIGPGLDLIIVETDSPAIRRAGGIWAGMSGSPVYANDGRWIGAVAFGLAFGPSPIAGLAAAEDMIEVLDYPVGETAAAAQHEARNTVDLPSNLKAALATQSSVTAEQLDGGFSRLKVPLSVSGLAEHRIARFKTELSGPQGMFIPHVGAVAPAAPPAQDAAMIVPGGNFAAALSYGDLTAAGVGTTTVVCDGQALSFGHWLTLQGEVDLSAHSADVVTIQPDPTLSPFKIANVGGLVGRVDQDRFSAIRAQLGETPISIPVDSTVTALDTQRTREGTTRVNQDEDLPFLAAFHLLANLDRVLDRIGEGTADVSWSVTGETASGQRWTLERDNRFASSFDIAFEPIFDLLDKLQRIHLNEFEDVRFTDVTITATAGGEYRAYRLGAVQVRQPDGEYATVSPAQPIIVQPGGSIDARVQLLPYQGRGEETWVAFSLEVPAELAGTQGTLDITGGQFSPGFFEPPPGSEQPPGPGQPPDQPTSFPELLEALQDAPRNDEVLATLTFHSMEGMPVPADRFRQRVDQVVSGFVSIPVMVEAEE